MGTYQLFLSKTDNTFSFLCIGFEFSCSAAVNLCFSFGSQVRNHLVFVSSRAWLLLGCLWMLSIQSVEEVRHMQLVFLVLIVGGHSGPCSIYSQIKIACSVSYPTNSLLFKSWTFKSRKKGMFYVWVTGEFKRENFKSRDQRKNTGELVLLWVLWW